jgi:hypothetical protein
LFLGNVAQVDGFASISVDRMALRHSLPRRFDMLIKLALAIFISLVLHGLVKAFAKLKPDEPEVDLSEVPAEMIRSAAVRTNRLGTGLALLTFLILCPAWMLGAWALDELARPAVAADEMIVGQLSIGRIFRAPIAAYVLAAYVSMWLTRLIIGPTYYLSMAAGNQAYGFNASYFFYIVFVWVIPFCIEYELHAIGTYALITKQELVESDTLLWPATHRPWQTLKKIELVQPYTENRAEIGRSPECCLTFADGYRFTDVRWLFPYHNHWEKVEWSEAMKFISQHSGVAVTPLRKIER